MPVRVLLVENKVMVRQGIRLLLERGSGIEVVGEAGDGHMAVKLALTHLPDIVVTEISLPGLNGFEATRQIRAKKPNVNVVVLSEQANMRFVARMFQVGALAYLLKEESDRELVKAIREVQAGRRYIGPKLVNSFVGDCVQNIVNGVEPSSLTAREREVLQLVTEGKKSKQIAHLLGVSTKTVGSHRQNLMEKTGRYSVAELTKYAVIEGLTSLE
ncbi:MAG: response regulator transcription factor [Gemmatimonadetes bacterium]|nr:response regulator transcription factor [Gemmatimonadota bacterium]MXY83215.1 response regulator transcription factor [Gemmatimonadota bacterium]MYB68696.1 response regulator transcription factor [Gemmatimonadota bacterium]